MSYEVRTRSETKGELCNMSLFWNSVVYMDICRLKQKNQGEQKEKAWNNKKEHGMEKSGIGNQWNTLRNKNGE